MAFDCSVMDDRTSLTSNGPAGIETTSPTKRPVEAGQEIDTPPAKKARLSQPQGEPFNDTTGRDKEHGTGDLWQPTPKRPRSSLLEGHVNSLGERNPSVFVSGWLQSVEYNGTRFCRSDTFLDLLRESPVSRQQTRSAPAMDMSKDNDGFVRPHTPRSSISMPVMAPSLLSLVAGSEPGGSSAASGSGSRISVEDPDYRDILALNNIHMRPACEPLPELVSSLVQRVRRDRDSPGPSVEEIRKDSPFEELFQGTAEPKVQEYLTKRVFPEPGPSDNLEWSARVPMSRDVVPFAKGDLPVPKFSVPVPDLMYGYNRTKAFPAPHHQAHLIQAKKEVRATNEYNTLIYPFFVIEFKGANGNLWVAGNQCLGGAATCVSMAERLNRQLRACKCTKGTAVEASLDSSAFSIAMNGSEARLYISWKHDELNYYMTDVESYLLRRPDDYIMFRKMVLNIIDWGKNERLSSVKTSLDSLLDEARKRTSEAAKSRKMPSAGPSSSPPTVKKARSTSGSSAASLPRPSSEARDGQGIQWHWDESRSQYYTANADGSRIYMNASGQVQGPAQHK